MSESSPAPAAPLRQSLLDLAAILLAAAITVAALSVRFAEGRTNFEEFALGPGTVAYYASYEGSPIHCQGIEDAAGCLGGFAARGASRAALWFGNSQLHGINQKQPGDESAPALLFPRLRSRGIDLLAFSQPNANLQEHYVLFTWLRQRLPLELLVLPLVFDDLRETGVRFNLVAALDEPAVVSVLERHPAGRSILANAGTLAAGELAGIRQTVQEKVEERLTAWLEDHWALWANRMEARGVFFLALWQLRNTVFGITPQSQRRMLPGRYDLNLAVLEALLVDAQEAGIGVLLYVSPIRNDIRLPYDPEQYTRFKAEVERLSEAHGATTLNLESLVPARYWGVQKNESLGGGDEDVDFMHFQGQGHRLLGEAVGEAVQRWLAQGAS